MTNHEPMSDSSIEDIEFKAIVVKQKGGNPTNKADVLKNMPTGSFPPLFMLTKEEQEKEEKNKTRTFSAPSNKTALSIKEIMKERRDSENKPFISF
jgi:hypothetical protein